MTTWMLLIVLAYSNSEQGAVALQSEKVDFFSKRECDEARAKVIASIRETGFKRSVVVCLARGSSMLAEPAAEPTATLPPRK